MLQWVLKMSLKSMHEILAFKTLLQEVRLNNLTIRKIF